jgi:hypothetical protein
MTLAARRKAPAQCLEREEKVAKHGVKLIQQ